MKHICDPLEPGERPGLSLHSQPQALKSLPTASTKWMFGTSVSPWMPSQSCFESECWPPRVTAVLPKVLPVLLKINFEVLFKNMLEKDPSPMLEEGAAAVMWVHTKWQPLLCPSDPSGRCQPDNTIPIPRWGYLWFTHCTW